MALISCSDHGRNAFAEFRAPYLFECGALYRLFQFRSFHNLHADRRDRLHTFLFVSGRPGARRHPNNYLFMKRYLSFFLLAVLACGCNDSKGDSPTGTGSETQQPVSPDEILPRRLVSVDVTPIGDSSYSDAFSYDEQGRLVSITDTYPDFGYEDTFRYIYTDNSIVAGSEWTYRLQNDRVVMVRMEEDSEWAVWSETTLNYDVAGYFASLSTTGEEGFESDCAMIYAPNGVSVKSRGNEWDTTLSIEFDRERLNNLNLDFYGVFCEGLEDLAGEYTQALLLGVGGQRLRYLPAKVTIVSRYEEEGQWFTDKSVSHYVYHMDGDYLSEVEIYVDEGEGELKEPCRIVFRYE